MIKIQYFLSIATQGMKQPADTPSKHASSTIQIVDEELIGCCVAANAFQHCLGHDFIC
jgi:hypothetical protein